MWIKREALDLEALNKQTIVKSYSFFNSCINGIENAKDKISSVVIYSLDDNVTEEEYRAIRQNTLNYTSSVLRCTKGFLKNKKKSLTGVETEEIKRKLNELKDLQRMLILKRDDLVKKIKLIEKELNSKLAKFEDKFASWEFRREKVETATGIIKKHPNSKRVEKLFHYLAHEITFILDELIEENDLEELNRKLDYLGLSYTRLEDDSLQSFSIKEEMEHIRETIKEVFPDLLEKNRFALYTEADYLANLPKGNFKRILIEILGLSGILVGTEVPLLSTVCEENPELLTSLELITLVVNAVLLIGLSNKIDKRVEAEEKGSELLRESYEIYKEEKEKRFALKSK